MWKVKKIHEFVEENTSFSKKDVRWELSLKGWQWFVKKNDQEGDQDRYNHFWYQGGCVLRPAESVAAFSSSAVELWSKRRKSFTVQVKLVIIYLRRRNGKLWYLYFVPCDGGAVIAAFDPRQPNEIAELRQGGLRGGVDNPFPLNPSFLNYR